MEEVKKKIAVLRHNDADGMGAAYAVWKALKDTCELLFISVQYSQPVPVEELRAFEPEHIYIVDFSYSAEILRAMESEHCPVTVLDHHKTAEKELIEWGGLRCFDTTRSGAVIAWEFFFCEEDAPPPPPDILLYVQDRDLWKFELENSKEINAYIATMDDDFEQWDNFYLPEAYDCGRAILKFRAKQVESRLRDVRMVNIMSKPFDSFFVPCVNASENISELGEAMCDAYPEAPFSVSYADRADGCRSYSLRSSKGFDVSMVAKTYGGGGHKAAAGFTLRAPDII